MRNLCLPVCGPIFCTALAYAQHPALFDYDHAIPFGYEEEVFRKEAQFEAAGAGFASPRGGKVNLLVVRPVGKGPFAAVVYQHGGGQDMTTYLAEAEVMARAGAVSLILDAPGTAPGKFKPMGQMSAAELRDYDSEIVVCYRRALDYLESLKTVDGGRIGFVGHSYGGIMGGVLAGVDRRVKTFVLIGGLARYTKHLAESRADLWVEWRAHITPALLPQALETLRPIDPDLYVSQPGHGPILFQCGNFDSPDNVGAGQEYFRTASAPKELRWYDTDHSFADIEATFDRMQWLEKELKLKPVRPLLDGLWAKPAKRAAPLKLN